MALRRGWPPSPATNRCSPSASPGRLEWRHGGTGHAGNRRTQVPRQSRTRHAESPDLHWPGLIGTKLTFAHIGGSGACLGHGP